MKKTFMVCAVFLICAEMFGGAAALPPCGSISTISSSSDAFPKSAVTSISKEVIMSMSANTNSMLDYLMSSRSLTNPSVECVEMMHHILIEQRKIADMIAELERIEMLEREREEEESRRFEDRLKRLEDSKAEKADEQSSVLKESEEKSVRISNQRKGIRFTLGRWQYNGDIAVFEEEERKETRANGEGEFTCGSLTIKGTFSSNRLNLSDAIIARYSSKIKLKRDGYFDINKIKDFCRNELLSDGQLVIFMKDGSKYVFSSSEIKYVDASGKEHNPITE